MRHGEFGIIDGDLGFGRALAGFLAEQGLRAEVHGDAEPLLARLPTAAPGLVLLGEQGAGSSLPVLRRIRARSRVPCIVLARDPDASGLINALDAGADDLMARHLPFRAMLARIRALLRRAEWGGGAVLLPPGQAAGAGHGRTDWQLVPALRQFLRPDGSECRLTTAEYDLMKLLVEARGVPVARSEISEVVFRRPFRPEDRAVDNLVVRLRRKLGEPHEDAVKTVRGAGYMFIGFPDAERRAA